MGDFGWKKWKELPYRGQPEESRKGRSKVYKVNIRAAIFAIGIPTIGTIICFSYGIKNVMEGNLDASIGYFGFSILLLIFTMGMIDATFLILERLRDRLRKPKHNHKQ